jgi:hypothetical protein
MQRPPEQPQEPPAELMQREHFTVEQLASLLDLSPYVIREAVRTGQLSAFVVDHHIIDIRREDVLAWIQRNPHTGD